MKSFLLGTLSMCVVALCSISCSDKDPDGTAAEVKLESFGFYAEDNSSVFATDYVITDIANTQITINIPQDAVKTAIIARFTTSADDVVTVNGAVQQSGVTVNNFSAPVKYVVKEGTATVEYTVNVVSNIPAATWTKFADLASESTPVLMGEMVMSVNPTSGMPYIAYINNRATTADRRISVVKLNGTSFTAVGSADLPSAGRVASADIAFNSTGVPYVAFVEYAGTSADKASVMSLNGSSWSYVGGSSITDVKVGEATIAFNAQNNPMLFVRNTAAGTLPSGCINIGTYGGASWSFAGIPSRPNTLNSTAPITAKLANGFVYCAIQNYQNTAETPVIKHQNAVNIYKYDGSTWTVLAENMNDDANNFVNSAGGVKLEIDVQGDVYAAYAEDNNSSGDTNYKLRVRKYTASTNTWSQLGSVITTKSGNTKTFAIALSPTNKLFFMYIDEAALPQMRMFDSQNNDWGAPIALSAAAADKLAMGFNKDGIGYAVHTNTATPYGATLYRFASASN